MAEYAEPWSKPDAVDYYARNRQEESDLYPSEKVFLSRVLFPGAKVLDVGCASGGFFNIMRSIEPAIDYTGIDIAEPSIEIARERYPEAKFVVTDGVDIPFDDNDFDLVHCTSVLVIEPRYQGIIKEMHRVANRFVLVDMRLLKGIGGVTDPKDSYYRIEFDGEFDGTTVPYVITDADEVVNFILSLEPKPIALRGTGYFHDVAAAARTPYSQVCMSVLLIQKGAPNNNRTEVDLGGLPIEFAAG